MSPLHNRLSPSLIAVLVVAALFPAHASRGDLFEVRITGPVEYNGFSTAPLNAVMPNDPATLAFRVDSEDFLDSPNFPTRGYRIIQSSLTLTMGAVTIALENPYPAGQTPFFVLRNNDPAVDGFLISENVDFPINVDMSVTNVNQSFLVTYSSGTLLSSLNIADAVGTYAFAGISSFQWTLDVGPANPLGMVYEGMTITRVGEPCPGNIVGSDNQVNIDDLLAVIAAWGACVDPDDCPSDIAPKGGDSVVNIDDLLAVIGAWGPCP